MDNSAKLPPVARKKTKLDPIGPDVFRRSSTNFANSDNNKAIQVLMEENEQLKNELEIARKEIFRLKEENLELKKGSKPKPSNGKGTFVTTASSFNQNGGTNEDSKVDSNEIICHNCNNPIAKPNYSLHVVYCERNLTECSYCKMKLNRNDLDAHIEDERGSYEDLLEAVTKGKLSDTETMYEHGNDIFALDRTDTCENTLLHVAVRNANKDISEFLIRKGLDVNAKNKNNESPLHHAVAIKDQNKAVEIIEMMLNKGADPYSKDKLGDSPIEKAKRLGKSDILVLFAERSDARIATPSLSFRLRN